MSSHEVWGTPPVGHTFQAHQDKAARCLDVADLVEKGPAPEWALIALFYGALHFTKAKIIRDNNAWSDQHRSYFDSKRNVRVLGQTDLVRTFIGPSVAASYKHLFDLGVEARYRFIHDHANLSLTVARAKLAVAGIRTACA